MYTDTKSTQPCGCDEGAGHVCEWHRNQELIGREEIVQPESHVTRALAKATEIMAAHAAVPLKRAPGLSIFPDSAAGRKQFPMFTGLLAYFPDALAAVAHVSFVGNQQHNPGETLRWAREKSTDQKDTAIRHQMDHALVNVRDTDGCYHLAKAIWRLCAELQLTIEKERA